MLRQKLDVVLAPWDLRQFFAALMIIFLVLPSSAAFEVMAAPGPQDSAGKPTAIPVTASGSTESPLQHGVSKAIASGTIMDAVVSRQAPTLNEGAIEGSLRVFEGKNYSLGSAFSLTGDLFTVGTPEIDLQAGASHGGVVDDGGAATPSYKLKLEKDVKLPGKIHIRADPVPLPADIPTTMPAPAGTRRIKINQASDVESIGDWSTVLDLTVNAPDVVIDVPPGNYDSIVLNGPCVIRFSAGDYNLASGLSLHQSSSLQVAGPASVTLGTSFETNGGKILASTGTAPHQVRLNILGNTVNLAGDAELQVLVRAIQAHVSLSAGSVIRGQLLADRLTLTGGRIIGDVRPVDTTPPTVQVLSPADNGWTYSSSITVQGTAKDEGEISSGVARVSVNGMPATFDPATGNWMVKVPLAVGSNVLVAEATDNAERPNTGRVQIQVERRNPPPPTLSITYPADGAYVSGTLTTVVGKVASESPEVAVSVSVNGEPATVAGGQFSRVVTLKEGPNAVTVVATDSLNQMSQIAATVVCDSSAPHVALVSVPQFVLPGSSYRIVAEASDNERLVYVDLAVDGQRQAQFDAPPFELTYSVPASFEAGRRLTVTATARDASGRSGVDSAQVQVAGPGGVAGRIFDDLTGYSMPGVAVTSTDGATTASVEDGTFFFVSPLSQGIVRLTSPGYTPVERGFAVDPGKGAWLLDARLTPLDSTRNEIGPAGGTATEQSGRLGVVIPAGALVSPQDVRLTGVSPQGLAGLLPFGWSPIPGCIVDLRPSGLNAPASRFAAGAAAARLTVSRLPDSLPTQALTFAFYSESEHRWEVLEPSIQLLGDGSLAADVPGFGQYAFLIRDSGATAPPEPSQGKTLQPGPVAEHSALNGATALATANPAAALYSSEAKSEINVTANSSLKLPSGIWCEASFDETYTINGRSETRVVARAPQSFVLYSYPAATTEHPNLLTASFVAKPTLTNLSSAEFRTANLHIVIRPAVPDPGTLVDDAGATVWGNGGVKLDVPAGAFTEPVAVFVKPLLADELVLDLPDGYQFMGGALVDLSGAQLTKGAGLSVPASGPLADRIVLARLITVGDRRAPKLIARALLVDGFLRLTTVPPAVPQGVTLPGLTRGGVYVFIRIASQFGYASGTVVTQTSGSAAANVRVASDTTPFVDLTETDGRYLLPGVAGQGLNGLNNLAAASLSSDTTGTVTITLAGQDALIDKTIAIASVPLAVSAVSPVAGAVDVPAGASVKISFSKPVNPVTLTASSFVVTAGGNPVAGQVTVLAGNQCATFTPLTSLKLGTSYRVQLTSAVLDLYGNPLASAFQSTFSTSAVLPTANFLKPEHISIGYPDAQGFVVITIPAGVIPVGSTVVALNRTLGSSTTVTAGSGQISIRLLARVGDEIQVIVRLPNGVDYRVTQGAYRSSDGYSAVGMAGGTVLSADGRIALVIEQGAIVGLAEIKLSSLPESSIPIPREPGSDMDPANVKFAAGVAVETRGSFEIKKELHLEVTAPPGAQEGQRAACLSPTEAIDPGTGQRVPVWSSITGARVESGRIKTTSPPFYGLPVLPDLLIIYFFLPSYMRVIYGQALEEGLDPEQGGIPDVLCVIPMHDAVSITHQVTARTGRNGLYSTFDFRIDRPSGTAVLFVDEVKQRRVVGIATVPVSEDLLFLYGLQGFVYARADGIFPPYAIGGVSGTRPTIRLTGHQIGLPPGQEDSLPGQGVVRVGATVEVKALVNPEVKSIEGRQLVGGALPGQLAWMPAGTDDTGNSVFSAIIPVAAEGGYRVDAVATASNGTKAEASYKFVALRDPNVVPPLEGAPFVLSSVPSDRALDVDVATDIRIEFSEPVKRLDPGATVFLQEEGEIIGGTILSGGVVVNPNMMVSSIVFKPERMLRGGVSYVLHVTTGVADSNDQPLDQDYRGPEDTSPSPYTCAFATFPGMSVGRAEDQGVRIAVDDVYAFTVGAHDTFTSLLRAYDISDPRSPDVIGELQFPQTAIDFDVESDTTYALDYGRIRRIGVVTAYYALVPTSSGGSGTVLETVDLTADRNANLWIFNLDDPSHPALVGVVSLYLPQGLSTVPLSVDLHEGRAYVGNAPYRGVIVVDIKTALLAYARDAGALPKPEWLAVMPYMGFGGEAMVQSVLYHERLSDPSMASSVSVLTQEVTVGEGRHPIPVAYVTTNEHQSGAPGTGNGAVLAIGFSEDNSGFFGNMPGPNGDQRILSWNSLDFHPIAVRAVSGLMVAGRPTDVCLVTGSENLWIFDVTDPSSPAVLARMALGTTAVGGRAGLGIDIEGTTAFIATDSGVAVVDFANPVNPLLVTVIREQTGLAGSLAVQDGFIHRLVSGGYFISVAHPVAHVFIHGKIDGLAQLCANPVVLKRNTEDHPMLHPAEIYFQIFGLAEIEEARVIIRQNETVLERLSVQLEKAPNAAILTGRTEWQTARIDLASSYTAQVIAGNYESERQPIPMSFLISDYQTTIQAMPEKWAVLRQVESPPYVYVIAANAVVKITVAGAERVNAPRTFGLNSERLNLADLQMGRYEMSLRAEIPDVEEPGGLYVEQVGGVLEITPNPNDVRVPNHTVVGGIDLASGQLGLSYTDIAIKNRGISLEFTRSYNQATANAFSPLGYGWHHNYQILLVHNKELGLYTIIGGDAQGETFQELSQLLVGTFKDVPIEMQSISPFHSTLVQNPDHSFDYYDKAHVKYHFPGALERDSYSYYRQAYMGNVDYIEEPNGNQIDLMYDALGRMIAAVDSSGRSLNFQYEDALVPFVGVVLPNLAGKTASSCLAGTRFPLIREHFVESSVGRAWRIWKITGPGGLEILYDYDGDSNLTRVVRSGTEVGNTEDPHGPSNSEDTDDYVWEYGYKPAAEAPPGGGGGAGATAVDLTHILWRIVSPNAVGTSSPGGETSYSFYQDVASLPVRQVKYPAQVSNHFVYAISPGELTITEVNVTDGRGLKTRYALQKDKVVSINVADKALTSIEYDDEKGLKLRETDPLGLERRFYHDVKGNLTRLEQIALKENKEFTSTVMTAVFDLTFNRPIQRTDANQKTTFYELDGRGNVTKVTHPDNTSTRLTYSVRGDLLTVTDRLGLRTTYGRETGPDDEIQGGYDRYGNPVLIVQTTEPGDENREAKTIEVENSWDCRSRLVGTSSTLGPKTVNVYDNLDRVVRVTQTDPTQIRRPLTVRSTYFPGGQLHKETKESTDLQGLRLFANVTYGYDQLDRRTSITEEISDGTGTLTYGREFGYDGNSNLVRETNRRGIESRYKYDELNLLTKHEIWEHVDGTPTLRSVEADILPNLAGNPETVTNRHGHTTTLHYDEFHRLVGRTIGSFTDHWTLDGNGNVLFYYDRNGSATESRYDALNRIEYRKDPVGRETTWSYQIQTGRGRTTVEQLWNGLRVITESDALNRPLVERVECANCTNAPYTTSWNYLGLQVDMVDPRGTLITKKLSAFGDTGQVTVNGRTTSSLYSGLGGLLSQKDARDKEWTYDLDGLNRVKTVHHPELDKTRNPPVPIIESFTYDSEGNLTTHVNRRGVASGQTYDHLGRVLTRTTGPIMVDLFTYDDGANTVTRTDANLHPTVYHYDPLRRLDSVKNALEYTKTFAWDGVNLRGETDFRARPTTYEYDEANRLRYVTDRSGCLTRIDYQDFVAPDSQSGTPNGTVRTITDCLGHTRVETSDGLDRVMRVDWGGTPLSRYEYDGNSNVTRVVDGEGRWTKHTYTPENWLETANHSDLRTETYSYDEVGNLTGYHDGEGGTIQQHFDGLSRVHERDDGAGNWTLLIHDGELLRARIDPLGHRTEYEYNPLGSLVQVKDALENVWIYRYDDVQNLRSITTPPNQSGNPVTTGFVPDELNRIKTVTLPLGRERSFQYDENGNMTVAVDPKGQTTQTRHDAMDRVDYREVLGQAGTISWDYQYDPVGNLFRLDENLPGLSKSRSYTRLYDSRNRVTDLTDAFGRTVKLGYDNVGNLKSFTDAASATPRVTGYEYDGANRLERVVLPGGEQVGLTWRQDNLPREVFYPGGMRREYGYDDADRVTRIYNEVRLGSGSQAPDSQEFIYTYYPDSNRKTETRKINGQLHRQLSYGYDALERLTHVDYGGPTVDFTYDALGNRKTEIGLAPSGQAFNRTYTYNGANQLTAVTDNLDASQSIAFGYDANGNLETEQSASRTRRFEHDAAGRLARVTGSAGGAPAELGRYDYDFQGRRIGRTTALGTTQYLYRGDGIQVAAEFDGWNNRTASFDFGSDLFRADLPEGRRWYFHDILGSTTALAALAPSGADPNMLAGGTVAHHEYDAWGQMISTPQPTANRVLYTGYRRDDETELDYALARYYDARFGRFLQEDPLPDVVEQARQRSVAGLTAQALMGSAYAWSSAEFEGREDAFETICGTGLTGNRLRGLEWTGEEADADVATGIAPGNPAGASTRKETASSAMTRFTGDEKGGGGAPGVSGPGLASVAPGLVIGPDELNPYAYMAGNPLAGTDPDGREGFWDDVKKDWQDLKEQGTKLWERAQERGKRLYAAATGRDFDEDAAKVGEAVKRQLASVNKWLEAHPRIAAAVQVVQGVVEVSGGVAMSSTVAGAIPGTLIMAHGVDNIFAGLSTLITGQHHTTFTQTILEGASERLFGDKKYGTWATMAVDVAAGSFAARKLVKAGGLRGLLKGKGGAGLESFPEWQPGGPLTQLTREGTYPRWFTHVAAAKGDTIQGRYWINRAYAAPDDFTPRQLSHVKAGFAPQAKAVVRVKASGAVEVRNVSKELHHNLGNRGVPGYDDPVQLRELWPWQHERIDPSRRLDYEFMGFAKD